VLAGGATDLETAVESEMEEMIAAVALSGGSPRRRRHSASSTHAADAPSHHPGQPQQQIQAAQSPPDTPDASAETAKGNGGGVTWQDVWEVRRQLVLGVGILTLQQLIGINTIMYYSVSILVQARIGTIQQSIWLGAPIAAAQLVGCLIGGALIDRCGRRPLALLSLCGVALSLAVEGGAFYLDGAVCTAANATRAPPPPPPPACLHNTTASLAFAAAGDAVYSTGPHAPYAPFANGTEAGHVLAAAAHTGGGMSGSGGGGGGGLLAALCDAKGVVLVLGMVSYLLCFGVGMSPVPWALNAELYPLKVRTTCVAIATAANWITNFIVAATFLSLQDAVGAPGTFWLYGVMAVLGGVWLCATMPETANRSLEQIERSFERGGRYSER